MTSSIFIKKSTVSGTVPTMAEITSSELALNLGDGGLFYLNATSSLVELVRVGSASFAETASFALNAGGGGTTTGSFTGSFTGGFLGTASWADDVISASWSETSSFAEAGDGIFHGTFSGSATGTLSGSASFAENASTAVLAVSAVTAITASNANTASFADPPLFTAARPIKTIENTNPYNVLFQDYVLLIDASSGTLPIDVVLPNTTDFMNGPAGKEVTITKSTGSNNVQLMASGSQNIVGLATATIVDQYEGLTLQPSGNTWWII